MVMGKNEQKIVENKTKEEVKQDNVNTVQSDEPKYGVTVGMNVYKPIPRFHGNCKNC